MVTHHKIIVHRLKVRATLYNRKSSRERAASAFEWLHLSFIYETYSLVLKVAEYFLQKSTGLFPLVFSPQIHVSKTI